MRTRDGLIHGQRCVAILDEEGVRNVEAVSSPALSHICSIVYSASRSGCQNHKCQRFYFLFWTSQGIVPTWKIQAKICVWHEELPLRRLRLGWEQWDGSICYKRGSEHFILKLPLEVGSNVVTLLFLPPASQLFRTPSETPSR